MQYYFNQRVRNKLKEYDHYSSTVIHAPFGYGKSTLLDYFMNEVARDDNRIIYRNAKEITSTEKLMELVDTLIELRGTYDCFVFLFLDNVILKTDISWDMAVQKIRNVWGEQIHLVVATEYLPVDIILNLLMKYQMNMIRQSDLEFTIKDIVELFLVNGLKITYRDAKKILQYTDGWIGAIVPILEEYRYSGKVDCQNSNSYLIEKAFFQHLNSDNRDKFFTFTHFPEFTIQDARILLGSYDIGSFLKEVLDQCPFVTFDFEARKYRIQGIFENFLNIELYKQPWKLQEKIFKREAELYKRDRLFLHVIDRYLYIGDFESMYTLDIRIMDLTKHLNEDHIPMLINVVDKAPDPIKQKHPRIILMIANILMARGQTEKAMQFIDQVEAGIKKDTSIPADEKDKLLGNIILSQSYLNYRKIDQLCDKYRQAYEYLREPSDITNSYSVWTYGSPSILSIYYCEAGQLSHTVNKMKDCMEWYEKLTEGHGRGADVVMEAEWLLNQGEFDQAQILALRGIYLAETSGQISVQAAGMLVLARKTLLLGDYAGANIELNKIQELIKHIDNFNLKREADLCKSYIYSVLGELDKIPGWIRNLNLAHMDFPNPIIPFITIEYVRILLLSREEEKILAIGECLLHRMEELHSVYGQIYMHLYLCVALNRIGNKQKAVSQLKQALDFALPDKMYMPFELVYSELYEVFYQISRQDKYRKELTDMDALIKKIGRVRQVLIKEKSKGSHIYGLTKREEEIARLAARRYSNQEIAQELSIAENTVKYNLKNVFAKMGVRSRHQLENFFDF